MATPLKEIVTSEWDRVASVIRDSNRILITTHVQADPDALGSELALAEALRTISKSPAIVNPTLVSKNYEFMDANHEIQLYEDSLDLQGFDSVFILDISRWERLGPLSDPIRHSGKPRICIDHHPYIQSYEDYRLVTLQACATAEIIYDLIQYLGISMNPRIAECLYTAILTDTGAFSFSNTNARSHEIAAHLLAYNVPARKIHELIYQNHSARRLQFMGKALSNLQLDCKGKLAWMTISHSMLKENQIHPDEIEGFVDMPRNCRDVLLSVLFLEVEPNDVKISFRAKGDFNANRLAAQFQGGGHNHASGARIQGSLHDVEQMVLSAARLALSL